MIYRLPREIIRVVLFIRTLVAVQTGNNLHFGRRKLEVEDTDILVRVRIVVAAGNGDQPALHVPTQDDLCGRFTVPGAISPIAGSSSTPVTPCPNGPHAST